MLGPKGKYVISVVNLHGFIQQIPIQSNTVIYMLVFTLFW